MIELDHLSQMALSNWKTLNGLLSMLTEEQLARMIDFEKNTKKRLDILVRMQQRENALVAARKLDELRKDFA
jgi:hypothetical protein